MKWIAGYMQLQMMMASFYRDGCDPMIIGARHYSNLFQMLGRMQAIWNILTRQTLTF